MHIQTQEAKTQTIESVVLALILSQNLQSQKTFFIQTDLLLFKNFRMGNTKSEQASNCQLHPRLGEVKLLQSTDNEGNPIEEMEIIKLIESEQTFNRWFRQTTKIDDSVTREVLLLPKKTEYESTGMCGSSGVVRLKYDYYPYVFQLQVQNRRKLNRFFLQTQLWYLLYNLIRAGSKFQKYHTKIGDVHPSSIVVNNDGLVKIISTTSFPGEVNNFQKFIENPHQKVYLAPEQLSHTLQRAEYPKNIDPSIAQCYSIGLCMLAAGTLQDIDAVYEMSNEEKKIQRHKINYYLKFFGQKYSSYLHSIVMGLLTENPLQRKKCSDIYASLYQHEDKILDLETFIKTPNSRLTANQQPFLMNSQSQQVGSQASQNKVNFYNPVYSRANSTNFYYQPNQNGFIVNPIESKYVTMGNVPINQSVPVYGPNVVVRRVGVENGVQAVRGANSVPTYNVQRV